MSNLTKGLILLLAILGIGAGLVVWKNKVGGHSAGSFNSITKEEVGGRLRFWRPEYTLLMVDADGEGETAFYKELERKLKALKPDADIYERTIDHLGIIPEESLFIDDLKENCEAAEKFGITAINYDKNNHKEFTE